VALQFHPEATYHMMCKWTLRGAERLTRPGAQQRPGHLGGWFQHDGRVAAWLEAFLPAWLAGRLGEAGRGAAPLHGGRAAPKPPATRCDGGQGAVAAPVSAGAAIDLALSEATP
jgi:hypothetical protein